MMALFGDDFLKNMHLPEQIDAGDRDQQQYDHRQDIGGSVDKRPGHRPSVRRCKQQHRQPDFFHFHESLHANLHLTTADVFVSAARQLNVQIKDLSDRLTMIYIKSLTIGVAMLARDQPNNKPADPQ